MQHTYLRYECADAVSLVAGGTSTTSNGTLCFANSSSSNNKKNIVFLTAGSQVVGLNLRTSSGEPCVKVGHRDPSPIGTGRALNSDQVICIDVSITSRIASGWDDGAVRIFDVTDNDLQTGHLPHSLLSNDDDDDDDIVSDNDNLVMQDPLVLNGHSQKQVRSVRFDVCGTRLASGGADGSVVIWDIIAETGLYRLLGHRGGITDISFASPTTHLDALITSSLDGLVKIWDLKGQCCTQTIASHRGEVWASACLNTAHILDETENDNTPSTEKQDHRWRLVTGSTDGQVRVWSIHEPQRASSNTSSTTADHPQDSADEAKGDTSMQVEETGVLVPPSTSTNISADDDEVCTYMGSLLPPPNVSISNEKVATIHYHPSGRFVGIARANSKQVEVYRIRSVAEAARKKQRRLRRRREKGGKAKEKTKITGQKRGILDDEKDEQAETWNDDEDGVDGAAAAALEAMDPENIKASDEFEYHGMIRASHKIRGFAFPPYVERAGGIRIVVTLATNALEIHTLHMDKEKEPATVVTEKLSNLDMYGHPTGIRSIALSSDDTLACTVSKSVAKVWNVANRTCLRSLPITASSNSSLNTSSNSSPSYYGLCATFLPGNTHVVMGTREGHVLVLDVASGDIVYTEEEAHDGAVWSIDLRRPSPQQEAMALMTGSADKTVKFWDLEESNGHPMLVHSRTLQMSDDVVCARYSHSTEPTKRMIFVSSLDSTVKVFFDDTLKFFLSLYGHKLPALAVDSSDDDTILASAGADKTIKIWGLDFGDTHRTLYGHADSITDLKFVKKTHYFFTTSKDGTVRYWDGDRFEQILLLTGHSAEVNCLAISRNGAFVLSGGMDRQVRVWERTRDMVFLEEEKERELETMFDKIDGNRGDEGGTAAILQRRARHDGEADEDDMDEDSGGAGDQKPQSAAAVRRSVLSVSSGDRIMEGLELADQEAKSIATFRRNQQGKADKTEKKRSPNPLMLGMEPPQYVLWVLRSVKSAELEQSLLVLPLSHLERLLYYLIVLLRTGAGVELCSRVSIFLIKTHQHQIIANRSLATPLRELRRLLKIRLGEVRDTVGFNLAALRAIAKISNDRKASYHIPDADTKDVWAGLGLGSDVAAALESKSKRSGQ